MRILRFSLLSAILAVAFVRGTALAHQSGCHRWHTCPSDTGSYEMDYQYVTPSTSTSKSCGSDSYTNSSGTCQPYSSDVSSNTRKLQKGSCPLGQYSVGSECLAAINACISRHGADSVLTGSDECGCKDGYEFSGSYCTFKQTVTTKDDQEARTKRKIEQSRNAKVQKSSSSVASVASSSVAAVLEMQQAKVQSVIDGDTLRVKIGKKTEKVRIIGIDTPETVDPRKPVQCFGKEASAKMKKLLNRKGVTLEKNPAEDRDKYKRLLRYLSLNGEDIGATMIHDGYAFSYKQYPHPKLEEYNALETEAREAKRGLWGSTCDYATSGNVSSKSITQSSHSV